METMNDYITYCTKEQTERAFKLGAPIEEVYDIDGCFLMPTTTQQMISWLREQGFCIDEENCESGIEFTLFKDGDNDYYKTLEIKKEAYRKEAEIVLISLALTYLEKGE